MTETKTIQPHSKVTAVKTISRRVWDLFEAAGPDAENDVILREWARNTANELDDAISAEREARENIGNLQAQLIRVTSLWNDGTSCRNTIDWTEEYSKKATQATDKWEMGIRAAHIAELHMIKAGLYDGHEPVSVKV